MTNKSILNIAHRGASARYPENTMAAFKGAVEMGADMIEFDVRLSADGIPVIFHNARLDSPINASGLIADSTLTELKKLDAGSWFHPDFISEQIPTLEETLAWASGTIRLNIELKTDSVDNGKQLAESCLSLVKKYRMSEHVLFSSFDLNMLEYIKEIEPGASIAILFTPNRFKSRKASELGQNLAPDAFHCTFRQLTAKRFANLSERQIPVTVYTVNSKKRMNKLIAKEVNGIITDRPNVLRDLLNNSK